MTGLGIAAGLGSARTAQVDRPREDARKNDANPGRQGNGQGNGTGQGPNDAGNGLLGLGLDIGKGPNVGVSLDVARLVSVDINLNLGLGGVQGNAASGRDGLPAHTAEGRRGAGRQQDAGGEPGNHPFAESGNQPGSVDPLNGQTRRGTPNQTPRANVPAVSPRGPAALAMDAGAPALRPMADAYANADQALATAAAAVRLASAQATAAADLATKGGTLVRAGIALDVVFPMQDRITREAQGLGVPATPQGGPQRPRVGTPPHSIQPVATPPATTVDALRETVATASGQQDRQRSIPQAPLTTASAQNVLQQEVRNLASHTVQHFAAQAVQSSPPLTVQNLAIQAIRNLERPAAEHLTKDLAPPNPATQVLQGPVAQNLVPQVVQNPATHAVQTLLAQTVQTANAQAVENPAAQVVQSAGGQRAEDRTTALAVPTAPAASSSGEAPAFRSDSVPNVAPRQQGSDPAATTMAPARSEARDAPPLQAEAQPGFNGIPVAATSAMPVDQPPANSPITVPVMAPPVASANIQASAPLGPFGLSGLPLPLFNSFLARRIGKRRGYGGFGLAGRAGGLWAILRLFGRGHSAPVFVADHAMGGASAPPRFTVRVRRWLRRLLRRRRAFPERST